MRPSKQSSTIFGFAIVFFCLVLVAYGLDGDFRTLISGIVLVNTMIITGIGLDLYRLQTYFRQERNGDFKKVVEPYDES